MFPIKPDFNKIATNTGLIENPFMLESKTCKNRMFRTPDPHSLKGHTKFARPVLIDASTTIIDNPTDENLSYVIGAPTGEIPSCIKKAQNDIPIDMYDYDISAEFLNKKREERGKPQVFKEGIPISFIQIDNEIEGINWYLKHYPKIPTDLLPIIARYHWGTPITKKNIRNEKKKIKKKINKATIQKGNFTVDFN